LDVGWARDRIWSVHRFDHLHRRYLAMPCADIEGCNRPELSRVRDLIGILLEVAKRPRAAALTDIT